MSSYSHRHRGLRPTADLAEVAQKVIEASDVEICGPFAYDEPVVTAAMISLNGSEELDEDYGTFSIAEPAHEGYDYGAFCNTGYRPYDEVVVAILVHAILTDNGQILTDGTFDYWAKGIALYEKAVRPLTSEEMNKVRRVVEPPVVASSTSMTRTFLPTTSATVLPGGIIQKFEKSGTVKALPLAPSTR